MAHHIVKKSRKLPKTQPRLKVFRSLKHIYALIVDEHGKVITAETDSATKQYSGTKVNRAYEVGQTIAKRARQLHFNRVIFNRSQYKYHGRIKALAEGAKKGGLTF